MTANVKYMVEQRRLLRSSRSLSAGSDSLYLPFKPTISAQSYPRTPQQHYPASRTSFSDKITSCKKTTII